MKTACYKIFGDDNLTFLQGLLTCDMNTLDTTPVFAAACNQKGRIIANFLIWREGDDIYLALPKSMSELLISHLKKYLFRSNITFEECSTDKHFEPSIWILPETTEQFTPQMIDLQKNGGVSFKKGCYLGQEIIARTEHLGQLKRHLYKIVVEGNPKIGDTIKDNSQQKLGTVVANNENGIFAVIEDRAIEELLIVNHSTIQKIIRY